jgi:DNA-binding XRE family transcriptional regulator
MQKQLNSELIQHKMAEQGLSVPMLAKTLDVSRESVYNWLKNEKFPHPKHLLEITRVLKVAYKDLFFADLSSEPIVAFRKKANTKTTPEHIERAINMGKALEPLVPYMGFPKFSRPATLKEPKNDYFYIQEVVQEFRNVHNLTSGGIEYTDLIGTFKQLHTVLVPVLWGHIKAHENALHIHLPKSMTTWIFINLDTHSFDFKFWMAHEIGHIMAPELRGDDGEDFADAFAGALLFPIELAKAEYNQLTKISGTASKVERIKKTARKYVISMYTVLSQVNSYAAAHNLPQLEINIGGAVTNFNKEFPLISDIIFKNQPQPKATDYIKLAKEFESPFFDGLKAYLVEHKKSASIISRVLNMPAHDAQAIYEDLTSVAK